MKKLISFLLVAALILSALPFAVVAIDDEVTAISYSPVRQRVYYEYSDGEWGKDPLDNDYFWYHTNFEEGDTLTVWYGDGSSKDFTVFWDGEIGFAAQDGTTLWAWQDVTIFHNQEQDPWLADGSYEFFVQYAGQSTAVPVSVVPNPVSGIRYEPVSTVTYYEGSNMYHDNWDNADYYFTPFFEDGDRLIVIDSQGGEAVYTYDMWQDGFFCEGLDPIARNDVRTRDTQRETPWGLGDDNAYYVEYMGQSYELYVTIVESPVKGIEYEPARPVQCYFESGGHWEPDNEGHEFYYYEVRSMSSDDELTVIDKDENRTTYTLMFDEQIHDMVFRSENGDVIGLQDVRVDDNQRDEHFALGDNNFYYVEYMGKKAWIQVSIVANPIESIYFTPATSAVIYENTGGHWDVDFEGEEFYYYECPGFKPGDTLSVTYAETGETVLYTYRSVNNDPYGWMSFFDEEGNELPEADDMNGLFQYRDGNDRWTLHGDSNVYYISYKGRISNPIYVLIVDNPVSAIRYEPVSPVSYYEGSNMFHDYWDNADYYSTPDFEDGDRLIVIDSQGGETVYTFDMEQNMFLCEGLDPIDRNDVLVHDSQRETPWGLGDNAYDVEYMGKSFTLYVTITPNPIKAIEYVRAENRVIYENTEGNLDYSSFDDREYFRYDIPWAALGDLLTVIDQEDNRTDYVCLEDEETHEWVFRSESGDELDLEMLRFDDDQYTNHWTIGDNRYFVEYFGVRFPLNLTIVTNPVKAIEYVPASQPFVVEGANCHYDEFLGYNTYQEPEPMLGDQLIVIDGENDRKVYVYSRNERRESMFIAEDGSTIDRHELGFFSNQHENRWTLGDENEYFVEYFGCRYALNVRMIENPVVSISFTPRTPASYMEGENMFYEPWIDMSFYENPRFENGDILTVVYADPALGAVDYIAEYNFEADEVFFVAENGDVIRSLDNPLFQVWNDQWETPWTAGGENYYYIDYFGKTVQVPVTIRENTIASISITQIETPVIFASDFQIETDDEGREYRVYPIPDFRDGDILTITDASGESVDYVLTFCEEDGERYFIHGDDRIHQFALHIYSDQDVNEWTVGGDNYYTVELYGVQTSLTVSMVETDVEEIIFERQNPLIVNENTNGELRRDVEGRIFYFYNIPLVDNGDTLTIKYINGEIVEYTVVIEENTGYLISASGDIIPGDEISVDDRQFDRHWVPGSDNFFYITYHGVTTAAAVTIKPAYVLGDVNGDTEIDEQDYTALKTYLLTGSGLTGRALTAADVNGDGTVDVKDLVRLYKMLA